MNKYDAAQTMNAGTSTKMSMDYQQTASNQSSVRTGTENIHSDKDQTIHEGSTWIQGPNGQQYELNGTFKQTAAGWEASGTFIDQNGKSWSGTMTGTAKNMEAFQNNVKNGDEAVLQAMSIDTSNLSRSHERHQDNISTANDVDQANRTFERKDTVNVGNSGSMSGDNIMVNGESVSGKVNWNGDTATIEGTKDGMKYTATVENASIGFGKNGMSVTGDIVKSRSEGGDSTNIDNNQIDSEVTQITRGTIIEDKGKSYSYNPSAIAQDIQSKHDANGSLDLIRQKYENMKEMEASGNPMAVAARADYEKAITAYSMAAAQGLPVSSSVGEGDDYNKGKDVQHYQDANWKAGGSGGAGPLNAGAGYSEGERINNKYSHQESSHNKVSLDTTALKIRDAIENGFDSGVSNGKILNSLGDRETYR